MKVRMYLICLLMLAAVVFITMQPVGSAVRDYENPEFTVTVGTSAPVQVGGYQPGRRYYLVINESTNYVVRHATWTLNQADVQATIAVGSQKPKGKPLNKDLGWWEDKYNVYQSSWHVILSSAGAPADQSAITAEVTFYERY